MAKRNKMNEQQTEITAGGLTSYLRPTLGACAIIDRRSSTSKLPEMWPSVIFGLGGGWQGWYQCLDRAYAKGEPPPFIPSPRAYAELEAALRAYAFEHKEDLPGRRWVLKGDGWESRLFEDKAEWAEIAEPTDRLIVDGVERWPVRLLPDFYKDTRLEVDPWIHEPWHELVSLIDYDPQVVPGWAYDAFTEKANAYVKASLVDEVAPAMDKEPGEVEDAIDAVLRGAPTAFVGDELVPVTDIRSMTAPVHASPPRTRM